MDNELKAFREGVKWGINLFCNLSSDTGEFEMRLASGKVIPFKRLEAEVDSGRQDGRFHTMKREQLLKEHEITEADVMEDEKGEYFLKEPELMDEGEPEDGRPRKVYIKRY